MTAMVLTGLKRSAGLALMAFVMLGGSALAAKGGADQGRKVAVLRGVHAHMTKPQAGYLVPVERGVRKTFGDVVRKGVMGASPATIRTLERMVEVGPRSMTIMGSPQRLIVSSGAFAHSVVLSTQASGQVTAAVERVR